MLETVSAAETALYCFLFSGSIFFLAICAPFVRLTFYRKEVNAAPGPTKGVVPPGQAARSLEQVCGLPRARAHRRPPREHTSVRIHWVPPLAGRSAQPIAIRQAIR